MNFVLLVLCIYLFLKYKDLSKDVENLSLDIDYLNEKLSGEYIESEDL